ncbi:hypothetical protein K504DRAFT_496423 [Pleomassaria siparia CBS 279.74]|uniref:Uncharacterized protein n=1 Tax=Pleomassaria siparia CBS 279.74 TaxID=1314801 RepID=A0A6G1KNS0_9PLEO|nr:hypothetical protein K504DRAFT_496423 [Pleomassaria siparia CBS 279.74]
MPLLLEQPHTPIEDGNRERRRIPMRARPDGKRVDHDDILALANKRAWRAHMQNLAIKDTKANNTRRKPRDWTHLFARKTNKGDIKRLCRLPDFHEGLERQELILLLDAKWHNPRERTADGYEADAGEVVPDEETRTKCLRFITAWANDDTPEETELTGNKATPPPYTQFLKEYKLTLQAAGKDKSVDAITRQPTFVLFTQKIAEIVKTFVIKRDEDTKRLDGKLLLVTANITVDSRDVPITYDSKDVQELATLKEAVERDWDALYRAAYEKGTTGQKSLRVNDIKHWLDDPSKSPLYDQFDEIIKGDKKWERLMRDINDMESTKKTAKRLEGARNKCLIGVNLPVIAHLYAIGLARRFNHAYGKPKDTAEIEKRVATIIHAGINQRTRTEHINVFNTLTSNT